MPSAVAATNGAMTTSPSTTWPGPLNRSRSVKKASTAAGSARWIRLDLFTEWLLAPTGLGPPQPVHKVDEGLRATEAPGRCRSGTGRCRVGLHVDMQIDLTDKTALVTGSSQGIGLAIATGLARAGAAVVLTGRKPVTLAAAEEQVEAAVEGARVTAVAGDIVSEEGSAGLLEVVKRVDVLVNNLGIFDARPALEITDAEWRRYFETNVLPAVRLTRAYLPGMRERGWGRIQYIASDSAVAIPAEMIHYGMSKTALLAVSRGFAKEAAGSGVTVNSVIAGPPHTGGVEEFVRSLVGTELPWEEAQREFMRAHRPQSLLQRLIEPEEIANMCVYLASPLASATTGGALQKNNNNVDAILP